MENEYGYSYVLAIFYIFDEIHSYIYKKKIIWTNS